CAVIDFYHHLSYEECKLQPTSRPCWATASWKSFKCRRISKRIWHVHAFATCITQTRKRTYVRRTSGLAGSCLKTRS
ncbi:hypothetical protein M5D96_013340, partial [Drosophila gunungcola]